MHYLKFVGKVWYFWKNMDDGTRIIGFQPIANDGAKILILGSMPSDMSLQKQQYYGHPRNAFWSIMTSLFAENEKMMCDYSQRKKMLIENNIAVWLSLIHI